MAFSDEDKQQVQSLIDASITQLKAESQTVEGLTTVTALDNIVSLPALQGTTVVKAPLALLKGDKGDSGTDAYTEAKSNGYTGTYAQWAELITKVAESSDTIDSATQAINSAKEAATQAQTAATSATSAATQATTAATDANTATEAANSAATAATSAATQATTAANAANTATEAANTATSAANTAANAATEATNTANTATEAANTAATNANSAATQAGNVNAELSDDGVLTITSASGEKKAVTLGTGTAAQSYIDVTTYADASATVDGAAVAIPKRTRTRLYPKSSLVLPWETVNANTAHLDTSTFTSMRNMFYGCKRLATVNAANWDTSNVTDMANVFCWCYELQAVDVSGWDTSKVSSFCNGGWAGMFAECYQLTTLDVSGFDTANVTSLAFMFNYCTALQHLDVSGWDTSKVTSMVCTFRGCKSLTSLDLSGWDASSVTEFSSSIYSFFSECDALTTLIGTHTLAEVQAGSVVALKGCSIDPRLDGAPSLNRESILAVICGLADLSGATAQTLTLGATLKARVTEEDIAIATAKNWVVA